MPAHAEEAAEAEREGIKINWLRTITAFDGPELTVEQMELDENGTSGTSATPPSGSSRKPRPSSAPLASGKCSAD